MTKILFADDDLIIRHAYTDMITDQGYDVISCQDGREAVNCCRQSMPALIILDIRMPELNGIAACREIRALPGGKKVPIIIISGDLNHESNTLSEANLFLSKPVDYQTLQKSIRDLLPSSST